MKKLIAPLLFLCLIAALASCAPARPDIDGVMLYADNESWEAQPEPSGFHWTVYFDGRSELTGYGTYADSGSESWTFSEDEADEIWEILCTDFKDYDTNEPDYCDGSGWRITSYTEDGEPDHTFYGAAGVPPVDRLLTLLDTHVDWFYPFC